VIHRRSIASRLENWARSYHRMRGAEPVQDRRVFDAEDALLLERAMPGLSSLHRSLLWWCYVKQETPEGACQMLGLENRPALHFLDAFGHARQAVEALVGHMNQKEMQS
jgi:DNA-directed RNA polymerase specialized sigma24 family protein